MSLKQVFIVNKDLKMKPGKIASQCSHAAVSSFLSMVEKDRKKAEKWLREGQKKIILKASLEDMKKVYGKAKKLGVFSDFIKDAGLTQVPRGSLTVLVLGPEEEKKIDPLIKDFKLV